MAASRYQGGTHNEIAIRKPRRQVSEETHPASSLILDFQPPEQWEKKFWLFKQKKKKIASLK